MENEIRKVSVAKAILVVNEDGTNWRYWNGINFVNSGTCSSVVTGLISNSTVIDPTGACEILTPTDAIKIQQQVEGIISTGDVVLSSINSTFIGNGNYYNISAINSFEYIVQINSTGIITQVFQNCSGI